MESCKAVKGKTGGHASLLTEKTLNIIIWRVEAKVSTSMSLVEFEDRARWGGTFTQSKPGLFNEFDINGHGTQCASIAAGKRLGVAKKANIIAVKTADKTIIHFSNVVRGLMYVLRAYQESGRPSIALLAFAGGPDQRLDEAAALAAAGNWGDNRRVSPAHVPGVISVGAIDMYDMAAKFSNWDIDLYAPGVDIIAATTGSTPRMNQAAPHVAGVIACILSRDKGKKTWKPLEMLAELKRIALRNVLSNVHNPSSNLLLHFMPEDHTLPPAKPQHVDPKIRVPSRHSEVGYLQR
ncbi:hypothetical protein H0H93_016798 [Arthromyces matolae]|nr:hypothetical protein H0H93_016798 [Arthromyces matolae]